MVRRESPRRKSVREKKLYTTVYSTVRNLWEGVSGVVFAIGRQIIKRASISKGI